MRLLLLELVVLVTAGNSDGADGPFACQPGMGPCNPVPAWPVTYKMNESLMLMGFGERKSGSGTDLVPAGYPASRWSIFDLDWDTAKDSWGAARPQNCSELMAKQVADMAASVPSAERPSVPKRYMTYRNFVKALPLLTSVREIMNDPSYDVWFVNFSHVRVTFSTLTICAPCLRVVAVAVGGHRPKTAAIAGDRRCKLITR